MRPEVLGSAEDSHAGRNSVTLPQNHLSLYGVQGVTGSNPAVPITTSDTGTISGAFGDLDEGTVCPPPIADRNTGAPAALIGRGCFPQRRTHWRACTCDRPPTGPPDIPRISRRLYCGGGPTCGKNGVRASWTLRFGYSVSPTAAGGSGVSSRSSADDICG